MINLIKAGAIAALATVGVIFGNVTASALETTPPAGTKNNNFSTRSIIRVRKIQLSSKALRRPLSICNN